MESPASRESLVVFWSWQVDSNARTNRDFIEDCIKRAVKHVAKEESVLIRVERDTVGVGGTPPIAETILSKIRSSDIFIWDATLVYARPRPAPNPNVLLELGYALAVMGDGRLIGVMNTAGHPGPDAMPFDLRHRRWPVRYSLSAPNRMRSRLGKRFPTLLKPHVAERATVREALTRSLADAIGAAMKQPKLGAVHADVDLHTARKLREAIDSDWLHAWYSNRATYVQYEDDSSIYRFEQYVRISEQPEGIFRDERIKLLHDGLVSAIRRYLGTTAVEMVRRGDRGYVISVKAAGQERWIENYVERYKRQTDLIRRGADAIWQAYTAYADAIRERYPEVTLEVAEK